MDDALPFVAVPKLVLREINNPGRVPPTLCPSTVGTTYQSTRSTLLPTSTANRSTSTGSDLDSEYQLQGNSASSQPPTQASDYGRELRYVYIVFQNFLTK